MLAAVAARAMPRAASVPLRGKHLQARNPATGELGPPFAVIGDAEAASIVDDVHAAFPAWRARSFGERAELMRSAAAVLTRKRQSLAELMTFEMGKPVAEALGEVDKSALVCNYYADNAAKQLADEPVASDAVRSMVAYEPLGVLFAIMPWNFPFWQVFRFAAPALMAGNVGVLKHASNVPGSAVAIEEVFREAGFPHNVFRNLNIEVSQCADIIRHQHVRAVSLTGSERAGTAVASVAGSVIKKCVLELGGSDAFIVLADVDVEHAAAMATKGRMLNSGQSCIAAKRFIVVDAVADAFEQAFARHMSALRVGNPLDANTQVGALVRAEVPADMQHFVDDARALGARVLCGGAVPKGVGAFYPPTVVAGVTPAMRLYHEEAFGPVATVIRVRDAEEAIAVANSSRYGLGGSVWSRDVAAAEAVARRVESGAVFVNGVTKSDPRLPFGGIKLSGYGRELSVQGIREFCNTKTLWIGEHNK